jgi:hypothetical protein
MLYPKYTASPAFTKPSGEPPNSGGAWRVNLLFEVIILLTQLRIGFH